MGWTLAEAQKLGLPDLMIGIVPTIVEESPLLGGVGELGTSGNKKALTFQTIHGNGIRINRELTLPTADWYAVGDVITSSLVTYTQVTQSLSEVIVQRDIDQFEATSLKDKQDPTAIAIKELTKSLMRAVEDRIPYGNFPANTKEPSGLHKILATDVASSAQVTYRSADATPDAGTLADLRTTIDLIKPGRPDFMICSRRSLRAISNYTSQTSSPILFQNVKELGQRVAFFDDIPVVYSDFLKDTETFGASGLFETKAGSTGSSIFFIKIGDRAFTGYENGGIQDEDVGTHQSKDAKIRRMKWYVSFNLVNALCASAYVGLSGTVFTNT